MKAEIGHKPHPNEYGFDDEDEVFGFLRRSEIVPAVRLYLAALLAWMDEQQNPTQELAAKIPPRPWLCVVCKQDQSATLWLCLECFQVACNVHRLHDDHDYRVTLFSVPCGCRAQEGDFVNEPRIDFCPKHAAADKMLAALRVAQWYVEAYDTREANPEQDATLNQIEEAINQAQGERS